MNYNEFVQFANQRGCRISGDDAFGIYRGYPFAAHYKKGGAGVLVVTLQLEKLLPNSVFKAARKALKVNKIALNHLGLARYSFILSGPRSNGETFDATLASLVGQFSAAGATPPSACPLCHRGGCDALALLGGSYRPVHQACLGRTLGNSASKAQKSLTSGSYLLGFLGAVLGGMVAAIPSVLSILLAERIFGLLFMLIPLGAYKGYTLCKGKLTNMATVITILVSLLMVVFIEFCVFYVAVVQNLELWLDPFDTVWLYFQLYTPGEALASMGPCLLFSALGIFLAWGQIRKTAQSNLRDLQYVNSTVIPYASAPAAPAAGFTQPPAAPQPAEDRSSYTAAPQQSYPAEPQSYTSTVDSATLDKDPWDLP